MSELQLKDLFDDDVKDAELDDVDLHFTGKIGADGLEVSDLLDLLKGLISRGTTVTVDISTTHS